MMIFQFFWISKGFFTDVATGFAKGLSNKLMLSIKSLTSIQFLILLIMNINSFLLIQSNFNKIIMLTSIQPFIPT